MPWCILIGYDPETGEAKYFPPGCNLKTPPTPPSVPQGSVPTPDIPIPIPHGSAQVPTTAQPWSQLAIWLVAGIVVIIIGVRYAPKIIFPAVGLIALYVAFKVFPKFGIGL